MSVEGSIAWTGTGYIEESGVESGGASVRLACSSSINFYPEYITYVSYFH